MLLFQKQPEKKKTRYLYDRRGISTYIYSNQTRVVLFLGKGMGQKPKQKLKKGGCNWARKQRQKKWNQWLYFRNNNARIPKE